MGIKNLSNVDSQPTVGFIIGTLGHGRGGHYWDLKTIAEKIEEKVNVVIFNIGTGPSPVLESSNVKIVNFPVHFMKNINFLCSEVKSRNIRSLFCIDIRVAVIAELVSYKTKTPIIHIKPGGPNPQNGFPDFKELIVYSKENYNYFKKKRGYDQRTLHFLPNRSEKVNVDGALIDELNVLNISNAFKFVQVIRICKEYEGNIHKAIKLIKKVKSADENVALYVIGVIQDKTVFERLLSMADDLPVYFITDSKYTKSASRLLPLGDAIIGNGRSVMEASSLGLPVLVSACNSDIPILLDEDSFEKAFQVNFSPRFKTAEREVKLDGNFRNIKRLIRNSYYREQIAQFSLQNFETYFDIESVVNKYIEISQKSIYDNPSLLYLLKISRFYLTSCLKVYRKK